MPAIDPVGPYERWMFGPGRWYDLPGLMLDRAPSLSAVAEFATPANPATVAALAPLLTSSSLTLAARLPVLYRPAEFHPHFLPLLLTPTTPAGLTAYDPATLSALLTQLATATSTTGQVRLNFPLRSETAAGTVTPLPAATASATAPLVILACIDLGIPFAHAGLQDRVDYCWSQGAETDGSMAFGREFTRDSIAALKTAHRGDEDAIYRAAGLLGRANLPPMPLARKNSHGAHILGTLAAAWPVDPATARIIAVDLPATAVWDTSGFGADMFLLAALHYIFDRAEKIALAHGLGHDLPVVVNLSYGHSGGPQDGHGLLGQAMDEIVAFRRHRAPTALVLPTGNMFQDRLHARLEGADFTGSPAETSLQWLAPPADRTSSFIELWYPPGTDDSQIRVTLTPPAGFAGNPSLAIHGAGRQDMTLGSRIVGQLEVDKYRGKCWRVTIILAPSEAQQLPPAPHGPLPAGVWTITLRRPDDFAGHIAARILRDTNFGQGRTGAKQSYFLDPAFVPFSPDGALGQFDAAGTKIRRFGTMNGMADGKSVLIAAGYRSSTGEAARYSSAGPTPPAPPARNTSLSATTDRAPFHAGITSQGTRTGTTIAQNGTSSAAPQAARTLGLLFQANPATPGMTPDNYLALIATGPGVAPIPTPGPAPTQRERLGLLRLPPIRAP